MDYRPLKPISASATMRRLSNRTSLLLAALVAAGGVYAQFRSDTRLVELHASVTDKHGKLLTTLKQNAFKVYENGQLQPIKSFLREDVPVSLGIIIDDSGSMLTKRARVEAAALSLVKESNPEDEVFIVNFNDEWYLDVPFTSDIHKMEQGIAKIDSRGGTAMRDAISASLDYMKDKAKRDKKVLLIITDGNDNASNTSIEKVVQRSNQTETLVYAIGLFNEEEKREGVKAKRALNELTSTTGGLAFYPKDVSDVQAEASEIARDLRNQYTLTYTPNIQELDGSYRQIKVVVDGAGKPSVRTRSGYYATPEPARRPKTSAAAGGK